MRILVSLWVCFFSCNAICIAQQSVPVTPEEAKLEILASAFKENETYRQALSNASIKSDSLTKIPNFEMLVEGSSKRLGKSQLAQTATSKTNSSGQTTKETEIHIINDFAGYTAHINENAGGNALEYVKKLDPEFSPNEKSFADRFCLTLFFGDFIGLLNSGELEIISATSNGSLLTFSYELSNTDYKSSGMTTVNRNRNWTIEKSEGRVVFNNGSTMLQSFEAKYGEELLNGVYPPVYLHEVVTEQRGTRNVESNYTFFIPDTKPNREEFRLTYYGLPEPEWAQQTRSFPWLMVVGFVGLVLAAIGFYVRRRYQ